jgi:hypothetical protein
LNALLAREQTDFDEVLRLAGEIAKKDTDMVRFTADAAVIRRLGRELVAKQETALAELVKNAYDADATYAVVRFIDPNSDTEPNRDRALLEIVDDGNGMTRQQLVDGFMRLASDDKVKNPVSPTFHRLRAGRKGIGRFAAERLGSRLTVVTQTRASRKALSITIDWSQFLQGSELNSIASRLIEVEKTTDHGTQLRIEGLNDRWSDPQIQRVFRYVSGLLQPFAVHQARKLVAADPGFEVRFERANGKLVTPQTIADAQSQIHEKALAEISARIDAAGRATWSMECKRFSVFVPDEPIGLDRNKPAPLAHARNTALKAYYYIFLAEFLGREAAFVSTEMAIVFHPMGSRKTTG